MNNKTIKTILIALATLAVFPVGTVFASEDRTFTCESSDCVLTSGSGSSAMFEEYDWWPGDSVTQRLIMDNRKDNPCYLVMEAKNFTQEPEGIAQEMFVVITRSDDEGVRDVYGNRLGDFEAGPGKTLDDVFNDGYIDLGLIKRFPHVANYDWTITFDPSTVEETYQGSHTEFDFDLTFECTIDETHTTYNPGGDGGDGGGGGGGGTGGPTTSAFGPLVGGATGTGGPGAPGGEAGGEVGGIATEEPGATGEGTGEEGGVAGTSDCATPWWLWLVIASQALLHIIITKSIRDTKETRFYYLLQTLVGSVFVYVLWKYCCPWWDEYLAGFDAVFVGLYGTRKRFDELKKEEMGLSKQPHLPMS